MNDQSYKSSKYPIIVDGISKKYSLAHNERPDQASIKDAIANIAKKPLKFADSHYGKSREDFYALSDISFKVPRGQVLAVMGKNGSGKSTLFKILARVTSPTSGEATINGRVGSLLEVGAGFHPELTGRENMYFNGSILGMKRSEIDENYDSILEFAEMDKFIDTPVKFYSSGMKVRLAFSIAIHLRADVLLLDEVLAVGDYSFRMKCFEAMEKLAASGKTILFVSHLPAHIRRICTHGILLREGKIVFEGNVEDTIKEYLEDIKEDTSLDDEAGGSATSSKSETPENIEIVTAIADAKITNDKPNITLHAKLRNISGKTIDNIRLRAVLRDNQKNQLTNISNTMKSNKSIALEPDQEIEVTFNISNVALHSGDYHFNLIAMNDSDKKLVYHRLTETAEFSILKYKSMQREENHTPQKLGPVIFDFDCKINDE